MNQRLTYLPGFYQYTYHTFVDTPQLLCLHCITPDAQSAFVSYPNHPNRKAAALVPLSWFKSITLTKLEGEPQLMQFLELLQGWMQLDCPKSMSVSLLSSDLDEYTNNAQIAA